MSEAEPSFPRILLVEDEAAHATLIATALEPLGVELDHVGTAAAAFAALSDQRFDLVLLDAGLPDIDGFEIQRWLRRWPEPPAVVFVTADDRVEHGVDAVREGAAHYIVKRPNYLESTVRVVSEILCAAQTARSPAPPRLSPPPDRIVGESAAIDQVRTRIDEYGPIDATVLVCGETGTGKELVARALHRVSARRDGPFVPVNCAAIPDTLLESELFGSRRGAYSGADRDRPGLLQEARRGTLFLDEVGELPLALQAKFLRVLDTGCYRSLGGGGDVSADVRFVAATNRDLRRAVAEGSFRADLYYRLEVLRIEVPPLRERRSDIPLLARHFVERYSPEGFAPPLAPEAVTQLMAAAWPGNVRELEHAIRRTLVHWTGGAISQVDLVSSPLVDWFAAEREDLVRLLARHGGDLSRVAQALGVSVRTVQRRLRTLGLSRAELGRLSS